MMKEIYYRQCILKRGNTVTTSWIPERFAEAGKVLKLKDDNGEWENGWHVQSVHARLEESRLPDSYLDFKRHRKKTGDDEPKPTAT
jgi:hypothetical protein